MDQLLKHNDGDKTWYIEGELHRLNGPAYEGVDGYKEWYFHDEKIDCSSQEEFEKLIKLKLFW